ncbi:MAG: CAP domain-containing protein [Actinomycetota bacterium]
MGKRTVSMLILGALVAGFIAVSAPAASALTTVESCFYSATNAERASRGVKKLALYSDLTSNARHHSQDMANDGTIYHNSHLGSEIGGNWWALGENVGMGPDCNSIQNAFMSSPGHKANILDTDYNQVGVGVVIKDETVYVTVVFAGRKSTSSTTTTTVRRTTTTRTTTARRTTTTRRATPTVAAAKPKPKPKPAPKPVFRATPRTVSNLIQLVGMDARQVDPATGAAMGI